MTGLGGNSRRTIISYRIFDFIAFHSQGVLANTDVTEKRTAHTIIF
jgi:hypothetical protein